MSRRGARAVSFALVAFAAGVAGVAGCGASAAPTGDTFVAYNADFRGYETWRSFSLDNPNPGGSTHVAGKRTIYINQDPPAGATEFPVGTIIVKETASDGKIFARTKRGGEFNPTGAVGWEWFELQKTTQNVALIRWRGQGPPSGEIYGGDPNAGCNLCHKLATTNDDVLAPGLMLTPAAGADAGAETTIEAGADARVESGQNDDASHE